MPGLMQGPVGITLMNSGAEAAGGGGFPGYYVALPAGIDIGDAGSSGASLLVSRGDHEHPMLASGVIPPQIARLGVEGVNPLAARADHTHSGDQYDEIFLWGNDSVAAAADTRFLNPGGFSSTIAPTTSIHQWLSTKPFLARRMRVRHNSAVGNGNDVVYELFAGGIASGISVTLASGAVGAGSDLANTFLVPGNVLVEMRATKPLSIGAGGVDATVTLNFAAAT